MEPRLTPFDPSAPGDLEWRQPAALKRAFELRKGESLVASVEFLKPLGTLARARMGGQCWTLQQSGFLNPVVTARKESSDTGIATFRTKWTARSGELDLNGETLLLRALNLWGTQWGLEHPVSGTLLRIQRKGVVHLSARYEVSEAGRSRKDLDLLLCLTWYVLVLMSQDGAF